MVLSKLSISVLISAAPMIFCSIRMDSTICLASAMTRCLEGFCMSQLCQKALSRALLSCTHRMKSSSITKSVMSYSLKSFINRAMVHRQVPPVRSFYWSGVNFIFSVGGWLGLLACPADRVACPGGLVICPDGLIACPGGGVACPGGGRVDCRRKFEQLQFLCRLVPGPQVF